MEQAEKVTLTQRRAASGGSKIKDLGSTKLKREKIQDLNEFDDNSNSAGKIVIWVVIIVALAVAAYLGLKTYLGDNSSNGNDVVPTIIPTPSPDPADTIISSTVLPDDTAPELQKEKSYSNKAQAVGIESENEYTIDKVFIQKYESFTRVQWTLSTESQEVFPLSNAEFDKETGDLMITMDNVVADNSGLDFDQSVDVTESVITKLTHNTVPENQEKYSLSLSQDSKFVLHTIEGAVDNLVVIDILEPEVTPTEAPDEAVDVTVTPTEEPEPTSAPGGINLSNEFSTGVQKITTNTTADTVTLSKYSYFDGTSFFTYKLILKGGDAPYPNVESKLEDSTLKVVISNVAVDAIVGNGGTGSTTFQGAIGTTGVDIANSNRKSIYTFNLTGEKEYRTYIDEEEDILYILIKH